MRLSLCFWPVYLYSKSWVPSCVLVNVHSSMRVYVCVSESHTPWHFILSHQRWCSMYNSYLWLCLERDACLHAFPPTHYTPACQVKPFIYSISLPSRLLSHIDCDTSVIVESPSCFCDTSDSYASVTRFLLMSRLRQWPTAAPCQTRMTERGSWLAQLFTLLSDLWLTGESLQQESGFKCTSMLVLTHCTLY